MPTKDKIKPAQTYFHERPVLKGYYKNQYNVLWQIYFDTEHRDDRRKLLRWYFRNDLFFLVYYGLGREDINNYDKPFIVLSCQMVEDGPNTDTLDLWARGHYKSTIITQGKSLQDLLKSPEKTVGIFSHTRPIAKDFVLPIKTALEGNDYLKFAFPDIIWRNPRKEAPVWSLDAGLELNRKATSNTHSLEASGLVDGMPTGKHFDIRVYDDVITEKVALSPDMINKVENQFRLSDNLAADNGWERVIGTNYSHGDFYQKRTEEAEKGIYPWVVRRQVWWKDHMDEVEAAGLSPEYLNFFGTKRPVLLAPDQILDKRKKQGSYIFACQLELNPANPENAEFDIRWLKYYRNLPANRIKYILIDPANEKKTESDYTAMGVISIDEQRNRYLEDLVRDKLNLGERWEAMKALVRSHSPVIAVYYEKYGKDSDIWYFEQKQMEEGIYFTILPMGGRVRKLDRIRRLVPICEQGRFYLPEHGIWKYDRNLVQEFIDEEYRPFPFCKTYDIIDMISRIEDPEVQATGPMNTMGDLNAMQDKHTARFHVEGL